MKRKITNPTHKQKSPSFLKSHRIEVLESRIAPATLVSFNSLDGSISVLGDQVTAGEIETLVFTISGSDLHISDAAHPVIAGQGFTQNGGNDVSVALSSFTGNLLVDTGTGEDTLTISSALSLPGHASLTSGGGITFNNAVTMAADKNLTVSALGTSNGTINFANANADLSATGTGAISLTTVRDINMVSGSSVTTVDGSLTLSANQQATATTGLFSGLGLNGCLIQATGTGAVTVSGRAGDTPNALVGIYIGVGGQIIGGTGAPVTVQGTGGAGDGATSAHGVLVTESGSMITSAGANVIVNGTGGGVGINAYNCGVYVENSAVITAGGAGSVTVTGTGGNTTGSGGNNYGVCLFTGSARITSGGGAVTVTGTGGGTGASANNHGVYLLNTGEITSGAGGSVAVIGQGGGGSGGVNDGILVEDSGSRITSGGGNVTMTGTEGTGGSQFAISVQNAGAVTTATNGGNITLVGDSMDLATGTSVISAGAGTATLRQKTNGKQIDLGGADSAGTLGLTDAELDQITAGILQIGDSNSGAITVSGAITYAGSLSLTNGGGAGINITNPVTVGPGKNLSISSVGGIVTVGANLSAIGSGIGVGGGIILNGLNITGIGAIVFGFDGLTLNNSGDASVLSGIISGPGILTKNGTGIVTLTGTNTYTGGTIINDGTLQISKDRNLGSIVGPLTINSATLQVTADVTSARGVTLGAGTDTFNIPAGKKITLSGVVGGSGNADVIGGGSLIFSNAGNTNTGSTTVTSTNVGTAPSVISVNSVKIAITGNASVTVTPAPGTPGVIESVVFSSADAATKFIVQSPKTGITTINRIISTNPSVTVGSIILGKNVVVGDGVADLIPDIQIAGASTNLALQNVSNNAIIKLGEGLSYLDTYNNKPNLTMLNVGNGVTIDATGDGQPSGTGGGGLGKVVVASWPGSGTIKTSQSITSFKLKTGDCNVVFQLDPDHLGTQTTASIGSMLIAAGAWGSSGSEIEGSIGTFSCASFLANATISAATIARLVVKSGPYMGTTTLTDPSAPGLGTITVNGNFTGFVSSASSIINVKVKGDFTGTLNAKSIGSITAYTFDGTTTGDSFGDALKKNIIANAGSLGLIKSTAGGIKNYEIVAATVMAGLTATNAVAANNIVGLENLDVEAQQINAITVTLKAGTGITGILNSTFETSVANIGKITSTHGVSGSIIASAISIGKITIGTAVEPTASVVNSLILAGSYLGGDGTFDGDEVLTRSGTIGDISILGALSNTSIAAGINPVNGIFGDGDDISAATGTHPLIAIGAIKIGAISGTLTGSPTLVHTYAIEAVKIKSLKIGLGAVITTFPTARYIQFGGSEATTDILVKQI